MKVIHCAQREQEWFDWHVGRITGSHAADVLNFLRNGDEGADRANYKAKKVAEILTGEIGSDKPPSFEMLWGIEKESEARQAYSLEEGVFVEQVGFVLADDERMGCSPDGFVGDKGIVGFKCPKTSTHIKWMLAGVIPIEHLPQARFELMVCQDRQWFDFCSFDPRLPKRYQMFTIRLMREDADIPEMRAAAELFNEELDALMRRLDEIAPPIEDEAKGKLPEALDGFLDAADEAAFMNPQHARAAGPREG